VTEADVARRLREIVAELADVEAEDIPDAGLIAGEGLEGERPILDSLDALKLGLMVEEEFGVPLEPPSVSPKPATVSTIAAYVIRTYESRLGEAPGGI
jgi:acyl carrier protein